MCKYTYPYIPSHKHLSINNVYKFLYNSAHVYDSFKFLSLVSCSKISSGALYQPRSRDAQKYDSTKGEKISRAILESPWFGDRL